MPVASKKTGAQAILLHDVTSQLRELETEQNVKIYCRHGAVGPLFGVSFANLKSIAKKIRKNHELARKLWATRNFDAMNLAGMIAEADAFDDAEADRWLRAVGCPAGSNAFTKSGIAIESLLKQSLGTGERIKGFKPHTPAFLTYLISHESHHRGQAMLILRLAGQPLDKKITYGIWEWGSR